MAHHKWAFLAIMICVRMSVMHTNALPCPNVCKYER